MRNKLSEIRAKEATLANTTVKHAWRTYLVEMSAICALAVTWVTAHRWLIEYGPTAITAKFAPVVLIGLGFVVVWRHYRRVDERLQKRILENFAIYFAITACAIASYPFLTTVGLTPVELLWVWLALVLMTWLCIITVRSIRNRR